MSVREDIDALVGVEGRVAGSDAERRAAGLLAQRLRAGGRDADVETIGIRPFWQLAHTFHAVLGIAGSVLSVEAPAAGAALIAVALLSAGLDALGIAHLARRLTGRRASQNVLSREDGGKPGTLVLVAHYDAGRTGIVFGARAQRGRAALERLLRRPLGPFGPLFWSLALAFLCAVLRVVGLEGGVLTAVQFVPTVVLIVHLPLLIDIALSEAVPAANDNASGVATAIRLAEQHGGKLEHFDVWLLLTGAQESFALGMREFLRRRRRELDRRATVFVNVDEVGTGGVRFSRREGFLFTTRSHPQLVALCAELAEDDPDAQAEPIVLRSPGDGATARGAGYPAITICCRPAPAHHLPEDTSEHIENPALERAFRFSSELLERLDAAIGPELRR